MEAGLTSTDEGRIDAAGLQFMRDYVGVKRPFRPWNSVATADAIWHFTLGVGDDNPLWLDRQYAEASPWGGLVAPPTFISTCATGGSPPGVEISGEVDDLLPGVLGLWANDNWRWYAPTREGMSLTATAELHSVEELPDRGRGPRVLQIERHSFYGDNELLAECDKSIIRFERSHAPNRNGSTSHSPARYTEADRTALSAQYDGEVAQRRGSRPLLASEVAVGDPLLRLVKGPLTVTNMVGWLVGWGSFITATNRLQSAYLKKHPGAMLFDDEYGIEDNIEAPHFNAPLAQKGGMPASYDFGTQRTAWLAHMITDWCGDDGFITAMAVRLLRPNFIGDTTWLDGTVTGKHRDDRGDVVDCEIRATNQRGDVTAAGTASVLLEAGRVFA
jgi:acyl dehydratase